MFDGRPILVGDGSIEEKHGWEHESSETALFRFCRKPGMCHPSLTLLKNDFIFAKEMDAFDLVGTLKISDSDSPPGPGRWYGEPSYRETP